MSLRRKLPALRSSTPTAQGLRRAARSLRKKIPAAFDAMSYHTSHGARYPAPPRPASWSGQSRPCSRFSAVSDTVVVTFSLVAHEGTAVHYIQPASGCRSCLAQEKRKHAGGRSEHLRGSARFQRTNTLAPPPRAGERGCHFTLKRQASPFTHAALGFFAYRPKRAAKTHTSQTNTDCFRCVYCSAGCSREVWRLKSSVYSSRRRQSKQKKRKTVGAP